ncbi:MULTISPECIES: AlbA family DNA-binding domain-containing protein [Bacillus]|uniref:AlbA family DNA-binding domain-containing protein n=1 Tax=Bacillus TaxID=1386 RepID=UPI001E3D954B|nr:MULTISPECIES: ATP-binding protein [Bacillus]MDR4910666.1 ATP-binding protein [Bacillus subtilis]UEG55585.1 ATP-binding protein [Bacillus sp. BC1-43]
MDNIKQIGAQDFLDRIKNEKFDVGSFKEFVNSFYGETNYLDYKEKLIEEYKIAKLLLAMANSGGGMVVFGIEDKDYKPIGLELGENFDITGFEKKLRNIIPDELKFFSQLLKYPDDDVYGILKGKAFIVIYIPKQLRYIPFLSKKESTGLKVNRIYVRRNTSVEEANSHEIEEMVKKRVHSTYHDLSSLTLDEHLEQLKCLYTNIGKYNKSTAFTSLARSLAMQINYSDNPHYPTESFDEFIATVIDKKKRRIEGILEVADQFSFEKK